MTPSLSPFCLSPRHRRFHRRNELSPAICIRASAAPSRRRERAAPARKRLLVVPPSFNLRGIILRMPRLVALLDEEENKLYSQVFSKGDEKGIGEDVEGGTYAAPCRQREERKDYRCAHSVCFPVGFQIRPLRHLLQSSVRIRAFGMSLLAKRFDLEACLALFTRLTRSTLRRARDSDGARETRG